MKLLKVPLVVLALVFPSFLDASVLKTPRGDGDRSQKRRQIVNEKLTSEMRKLQKDHLIPRKTFKPRRRQEEDESAVEEEEEGRTLIVECSENALFQCSTCGAQLEEEQDRVWQDILNLYPDSELVSSTKRLVNALYVKFIMPTSEEEAFQVDTALRQIEGVQEVTLHGALEMEIFPAVDYIGGYRAQEELCASGRDVRVAVLDGGIDYTHYYLGGEGTEEAYEDAYGRGSRSPANRQRDGLFPTDVVVDGFDFIGEFSGVPLPDEDPIDSFGHGTAVSHAILTVAPNAKLVGLKVCSMSMACPVFSIIQGLEFALDPNGDNDIEDKVDIVNLSLGLPFISPYYTFLASILESVFALGVLPVVAAGNSGNIPFVLGGLSGSPNPTLSNFL